METDEKQALLDHFEALEDPRSRQSPHDLKELLLTAVCAVLSGADTWTAVALLLRSHEDPPVQFRPLTGVRGGRELVDTEAISVPPVQAPPIHNKG